MIIINVQKVPDQLDNDRDVVPLAPAIISSLKQHVEARGIEAIRNYVNKTKRPKGQAVMADIFGVTLDPIVGKPLDEFWAAVADYVKTHKAEGDQYLINAKINAKKLKTDNDAKTFPSHSLGQLALFLRQTPKHQHLSPELRNGDAIKNMLNREADYAEVKGGRKTYLQIEVEEKVFAMRIVKNETRFIFIEESEFIKRRNLSVVEGDSAETEGSAPSPDQRGIQAPAEEDLRPPAKAITTQEAPSGSGISFTNEELLKNG
jgi:hypothetical protein